MDKRELILAAMEKLPYAYAPYSHFHVAAALLGNSGAVYTGVNVENASYPAGLCAERAALAMAVSGGERAFSAIAIGGGRDGNITDYCAPCGICRQALREFVKPEHFLVILFKSPEDYKEYTLEELLPESFGPANLREIKE